MQSFRAIKDKLLANPQSPSANALYLAACKKHWEPVELLLVRVVDSSIQHYLDTIDAENMLIGGYPLGFLYQCLFHKVAHSYNWENKTVVDDNLWWYPENNTVGLEVVLYDAIDELEITYSFEEGRNKVIRIPEDQVLQYEDNPDQAIIDLIYETTGFPDLELASFKVKKIEGSLAEVGRATILLTFEGADWLGNSRFISWEQNKMESYVAQERPRLLLASSVQNTLWDSKRQKLCKKVKAAEKSFFAWSKQGKGYTRIPRNMPLEILIDPKDPPTKSGRKDLRYSIEDILETFGEVGVPKAFVEVLPNGSTVLARPDDIGEIAIVRAAKRLKLTEIRVWVLLRDYGQNEIYYPLPALPIA